VAATHAALTVRASVQTYYRNPNRRTQNFGRFAPVEMSESTDARGLPATVHIGQQTDARNSLAKRETFPFVPSVVGEIDFADQTLDLPCFHDLLALLLGDLGEMPLEDLQNMSVF
jgi:hypothetical protein